MDISKWFDTFVDIEPSNYDSCSVIDAQFVGKDYYKFKIITINNIFISKIFDNKQLAEYYAQECLKKIREDE